MRTNANIQLKSYYTCKVTNKEVTIQILASSPKGGWEALNTATGKTIHIKGPERLVRQVDGPAGNTEKPESSTPSKQAAKSKMSLLDAAAVVLETESPLTSRQMIERMAAAGLWTSNAATPSNTLHAAISKEIRIKKDQSRFAKIERGQFSLARNHISH